MGLPLPRVTIEAQVFGDPRFEILAKGLRTNVDAAIGRMARIWLLCNTTGRDCHAKAHVAQALRCKPDRVVEVFCEQADLGELAEDGTIRIRGCAGRTDWRERGQGAREDARAGCPGPDAVSPGFGEQHHEKIMEALQDGPLHTSELEPRIGCRHKVFLDALRCLVENGYVTKVGRGVYALSGSQVPGSGSQVPGSGSQVENKYISFSLSPGNSQNGNRELGGTGTREPREQEHASDDALLAMDEPVPAGNLAAKDRSAKALWRYQNLLRRQLDPDAPDPICREHPGGELDPVRRWVGHVAPCRLRDALDLFALEGRLRAKTRKGPPLEYLNGSTNWKDEPLKRKLATTKQEIMALHGQSTASAGPTPAQLLAMGNQDRDDEWLLDAEAG